MPRYSLTGSALALGKRIATRAASEPVGSGPVAIRRAAAVLRIVGPIAAPAGKFEGRFAPQRRRDPRLRQAEW